MHRHLNPGSFSSADGMIDNISIARNTWINNAVGGSGNDVIHVNDKGDVIREIAGNNWLYGGAGNDTLIGGHDLFIAGAGVDTSAITTAAGDHLTFIGSADFTDAAGQLRFANGQLLGDLNGDGLADFQINRTTPPSSQ